MSEGVFAVANVFSFARIIFLFQVSDLGTGDGCGFLDWWGEGGLEIDGGSIRIGMVESDLVLDGIQDLDSLS